MPETIETILSRRSIRHFTPEPVEHEALITLLKAAMAAPTACNSQPWEFIVVTEPEVLARIRQKLIFARYNPPAAMVVCGNPDIANNVEGRRHWEQDCSAATENILLAAAGLGLSAVWIGVHPYPSKIKPVAEVLGIPENVTPLRMVYVGHPAEAKPPRNRYDEHKIYLIWRQNEPNTHILHPTRSDIRPWDTHLPFRQPPHIHPRVGQTRAGSHHPCILD